VFFRPAFHGDDRNDKHKDKGKYGEEGTEVSAVHCEEMLNIKKPARHKDKKENGDAIRCRRYAINKQFFFCKSD
jgi:hypothetical protein